MTSTPAEASAFEELRQTLEQVVGLDLARREHAEVREPARDEVLADLTVEATRVGDGQHLGERRRALGRGRVDEPACRALVGTSATSSPSSARAAAKLAATLSWASPTGEVTTMARGS